MTASTPEQVSDLTGKNRGWWHVVAFAGEREGVRYWRSMCRAHLIETVIGESEIRNPKTNSLRLLCRCSDLRANPIGCIFGQWTVIELGTNDNPGLLPKLIPTLICRCVCGAQRDIAAEELFSWKTFSCGCRSERDIRLELRPTRVRAHKGLERTWKAFQRQEGVRRDGWTLKMNRALAALQTQCVNCGAISHLATDHVKCRDSLRPGNAVRLCRSCNSFKSNKDLSELAPGMVSRLATAAAAFEAIWNHQLESPQLGAIATTAPGAEALTPVQVLGKLDPNLMNLLEAIDRKGDDASIQALADRLEQRGDPRAREVRNVTNQTHPDLRDIMFLQDHLELLRFQRAKRVWKLLGLAFSQRSTLHRFLADGSTIEGIAQDDRVSVQAIRNRIELAMSKLACL